MRSVRCDGFRQAPSLHRLMGADCTSVAVCAGSVPARPFRGLLEIGSVADIEEGKLRSRCDRDAIGREQKQTPPPPSQGHNFPVSCQQRIGTSGQGESGSSGSQARSVALCPVISIQAQNPTSPTRSSFWRVSSIEHLDSRPVAKSRPGKRPTLWASSQERTLGGSKSEKP